MMNNILIYLLFIYTIMKDIFIFKEIEMIKVINVKIEVIKFI